MPGLSADQLQQFRERLLDTKASIEEMLSQTDDERRPVEASGSTIGRLSRLDAMQVQAISRMGRSQLEVRLKQVEAGLTRLDIGKYGICPECGEAIGINRLEALPEAPFCVDCQESFEA